MTNTDSSKGMGKLPIAVVLGAVIVALALAYMWAAPAPEVEANQPANKAAAGTEAPTAKPAPGKSRKVMRDNDEPQPAKAESKQIADKLALPADLQPLPKSVTGPARAKAFAKEREITDQKIRRHTLGQAASGALACMAQAGVDRAKLDKGMHAQLLIGEGTNGEPAVVDVELRNATGAPATLTTCLEHTLRAAKLKLPKGTTGVVSTPPLVGQPRPNKAAPPSASKQQPPAGP
ncbi:MAG: hypothetical protein KC502_08660 [Myxococcales bacterium]|nr:hypothetical protein [Myxococcales bacterium]